MAGPGAEPPWPDQHARDVGKQDRRWQHAGRDPRRAPGPRWGGRGPVESVWAPHRRRLTVGLVFTITLVAFEALAISTVMPVVADDLGGLALSGWVFSGSSSGACWASCSPARRPTGGERPCRTSSVWGCCGGAVHRRPGAVDGGARRGAHPPGHRRRRDPGHRVHERRAGVPRRHPATRVRGVLLGMGDPGADRTGRGQRHRRGGHVARGVPRPVAARGAGRRHHLPGADALGAGARTGGGPPTGGSSGPGRRPHPGRRGGAGGRQRPARVGGGAPAGGGGPGRRPRLRRPRPGGHDPPRARDAGRRGRARDPRRSRSSGPTPSCRSPSRTCGTSRPGSPGRP